MSNCPTMRRKRLRHVIIRTIDGTEVPGAERIEWVDEPCGTPLFSGDGLVCESCRKGWAVATNFPLSRSAEFYQAALAAGDPRAIAVRDAKPMITARDLIAIADYNACGDPQPDGMMLVGAAGGPYVMTEAEWIEYVALCRAQDARAARALAMEM